MDSPLSDKPADQPTPGRETPPAARPKPGLTRREVLKRTAIGVLCLAGAGSVGGYLYTSMKRAAGQSSADVFKGGAPDEQTFRLWQGRGWVKEAYHYIRLGRNVQCKICPNNCLLAPGDRSHCRNKINRDSTLYTLAYGNPCSFHVDPVEKKPLFHFYPGTETFSLATAGCVFRCLNCQNWEISQKTPEQTKDASGPQLRYRPPPPELRSQSDLRRLSMFPEDVVAVAQWAECPSISYTYSEPTAYYEYAYDTCKLARESGIKNILVTCGSINERPLRDIGQFVDAAHVDLKGFDEATYKKLNSGRLQPILDTLKTLRGLGVWFEIINLIVPTHTDKPDQIKRMCGWLADNLGPDTVLHFSRFQVAHQLDQLWPTPAETLLSARSAARAAGLRYVYIGNAPELSDVENTYCPSCSKAVIERRVFAVTAMNLAAGRCKFCQTPIAGVWG